MAQPDVECGLCGGFSVGGFGVAGDAFFDRQQPGVGAGCLRGQVGCGGEAGQEVAGQDAVLVVAQDLLQPLGGFGEFAVEAFGGFVDEPGGDAAGGLGGAGPGWRVVAEVFEVVRSWW